jgi:NIMA (never in mitosis gene a)-related kinase
MVRSELQSCSTILLILVVFLGENNGVRLGDFGLSKIIASHDFASTYVGTPFYMSPEICAAENYSTASDIWSLGCIIYELATRKVPFEARSHMELVLKIKNGVVNKLPPQYSQDLWDAISWCLKTNPNSRPDCAQLLSFANIKVARTRLEQAAALGQLDKVVSERDSAMSKLQTAQKQLQELQSEILKLRDANKKVEMEWHARATLAIDQKVHEASERNRAELLAQFEAAVEVRAEEKLSLHLASLASNHKPVSTDPSSTQTTSSAIHVRSSTPPPGKHAATAAFSHFSRNLPDPSTSSLPDTLAAASRPSSSSSALLEEPDLTSLSLTDDPAMLDDGSPLARRVAKPSIPPPKKSTRKPFTRAKTLANCNFGLNATRDSPMDVHMASPSPMHAGYAAQQGARFGQLGLSPRRNAQTSSADGLPARDPLKRNIFSVVASAEKGGRSLGEKEKENRPPVRGRTLVELSSQQVLQSPAKWNHGVHGEEMPSPWVKRR